MEEVSTPINNRAHLLAESVSEAPDLNPPANQPVNESRNFMFQLKLLLTKNLLVQKRSLKSLLIQLFAPILICILIYFLQLSANSVVGQSVTNPPIISIDKVPQCVGGTTPTNCSSLTYAVVVKNFTFLKLVYSILS